MTANEDFVWRPKIELTEENNAFSARALLAGVDSKNLEIWIAPRVLLIKGEVNRGTPARTKLFCSTNFPRPVNPHTAHAKIKGGVLLITADIARSAAANKLTALAA